MMGDKRIVLHFEGALALLQIAREQKRNALDMAMIEALGEHCQTLNRRSDLRLVAVMGSGSQAFCAGGDIVAWAELSAADFAAHWIMRGHAMLDALANLRHPVVALLNGDALGGGLELAAAADLRIAESHIHLGQPEGSLGMVPGWSGSQRLVRRFGATAVRRMALFGELFSAAEAARMGVVDRVVESGQGLAAVRQLAQHLSTRGPLASETIKRLINIAEGDGAAQSVEALAGRLIADSAELETGKQAFQKRRPAHFDAPDG